MAALLLSWVMACRVPVLFGVRQERFTAALVLTGCVLCVQLMQHARTRTAHLAFLSCLLYRGDGGNFAGHAGVQPHMHQSHLSQL
jgi:hypothetical protein